MPPAPLARSGKSERTTDSPITYFIQKALEEPALITFAAGLVDEDSFPVADVGAAAAAIASDSARARSALQYGSTQGLPELCGHVLQHVMSSDGIDPRELNLSPADVVITTGSQQLLYLLGELFVDPGDIVITEAPSYFVYHSLLQSHGAHVLTVPMDADGMRLDALEALLARLETSGELGRVKLIYTVDYFQNPTGLTLSAERRPKMVELVRRFSTRRRILILEDAAYRELRYSGPDLPSLKRFDPRNEFVVYAGTFSKSLAPGLKTGYAILPPDVREPLLHLKGSHDFGSTNFAQHLVAELISSGAYRRHILELRAVYRRKRDLMLSAFEQCFSDVPGATWTVPAGGLYVWLTLPGIDTGPNGPLVQAAIDAGVLYVPGQFGHVPDETGRVPINECRICFGVATPEEITEGVRRLHAAVSAVLGASRTTKLAEALAK